MKLNVQKRLAADIKKSSPKRIKFDESSLEDIKEAITKRDIKALIDSGAISVESKRGVSRGRARKAKLQKKKGLRTGHGSRKGTKNARSESKRVWINKIRTQRKFLKELKESGKIDNKTYRELYMKSKGGFFRSKRHIKLYLGEKELTK